MAKIVKTDAEWRDQLSDLAYHVTREHGTERAFTHDDFPDDPAVYRCIGCGTVLFDQADKFDAGCGWPSFTRPADADNSGAGVIGQTIDNRYGMRRVEVHCSNCGAHMGHVFPDGPGPLGLRYCINGVALDRQAEGDEPEDA